LFLPIGKGEKPMTNEICVVCGNKEEVTYNFGISDFYCAVCGQWQAEAREEILEALALILNDEFVSENIEWRIDNNGVMQGTCSLGEWYYKDKKFHIGEEKYPRQTGEKFYKTNYPDLF
jgi:ribosomal protein L37E